MSIKNKKGTPPRLRFPGFKGEWIEKPLGDIMTVTSCKRVHESDWTSAGVTFFRAREIVALRNKEKISPLFISEELYQKNIKLSGEVSPGDLLVTGVGTIGVPYLVKEGDRFYFKDGNIIWFQNRSEEVSGNYLYWLYESDYIKKQISKMAGIGTVGTYTIDNAKRTLIPLSTQAEQQKIAATLSSLDELITVEVEWGEALKAHKRGLMQALFPAEGESVPRVRFEGFEGEWQEKKLGELMSYFKGFAFKSSDYRPQGYRIVRVSDLSADSIKTSNEQVYIDENRLVEFNSFRVLKGDVIITTVGSKPELRESSVGRPIYVSGDVNALLNQNLLILRPRENQFSYFFYCQLLSENYLRHIMNIHRGNANQSNITVVDLLDFKIKSTSTEEQQKIADTLSSLDDLIIAKSQKIEALKAHKRGLMHALFPSSLSDSSE